MRLKVLLTLTLFLNLLVHPVLHAAEQWGSAYSQASHSVHSLSEVSSPECEFCHMAGSVHAGAPIAAFASPYEVSWLHPQLQVCVPSIGAQSSNSPRAPPLG